MSMLGRYFGQGADLALVLLVLGILVVLFAPVPAGFLDFLIVLNFGFALLILLVTFYAPRPVDFSTFPAILLVSTLFRLALNVSATRLILNEGDAGHVIGAVGSYVVAGNYVIGFVVFLILIVVQYVVVTSGAQRVSEVAARFTLDSLPGQQMSIDADLNMGFIDQDEAKRRRKTLEREAAFYGAMDGASKFVKGDAIAGIVIMLINVIGGLVIGVLQMGMPWGDALRHYTLLTIGDGIVTQVPALVVSVGTGVIVTRSASDSMLGLEVFRQITAYPRTLVLVALALLGLGGLPGMPLVPSFVVVLLMISFYFGYKRLNGANSKAPADKSAVDPSDAVDPYIELQPDAIEFRMGSAVVQMVGADHQASIIDRVAAFRKSFSLDTGVVLPKVKFKDRDTLQEGQYEIALFGDVFATGYVVPNHMLAIHPSGAKPLIKGIETRDPSYGLPAVWIGDDQKEQARASKCALVDPVTVMVTHLTEVLRQQAHYLLTRSDVDRMLGGLRVHQPGLVEELIPTQLGVSDVHKILQVLLRERVPVRNLQGIIEALLEGVKTSKDVGLLIEVVRQRLAVAICNGLASEKRVLHVMTIQPDVEGQLLQSVSSAGDGRSAMADPKLAELLVQKIAQQTERMMKNNLVPVVLCSVELRRYVRALAERAIPHLRVISVAEVPVQFDLKAFSTISLKD